MSFEINLRAKLIADVDLNEGRVYPQNLPHDPDLPAQTYNIISSTRTYSHSGDSGAPRKRVQIDSWAESYGQAKQMAEQTIAALSGFMGVMNQDTTVGVSHMENEMDARHPETGWSHIPVDFVIGYYEDDEEEENENEGE